MSSIVRPPVLLARGLLACSAAGLLVATWASTTGGVRVAGAVAALTVVVVAAAVRSPVPCDDPVDGAPACADSVAPRVATGAAVTAPGRSSLDVDVDADVDVDVDADVDVDVDVAMGRADLLLGHTSAGAAVVAGGLHVTVVGRGALARAVHGALCVALAERCGDGDQLRTVGRVDDDLTDRLTRRVSAASDDARCRDLGVAIVSLVGADGMRRGVVQLVPESLRPRWTPVAVEVGAGRCTATLGDDPPVTITPLLPTVLV